MTTAICIPVKRLSEVKTRLASALTLDERRFLVLLMLGDILAACQQVNGAVPLAVIGADPEVEATAVGAGARFLRDTNGGLNGAVRQAAQWAEDLGISRLLILPGDIPSVTPMDLNLLLGGSERQLGAARGAEEVVVVPAHDGDGTNGLLLTPPQAIAPRFGPGSCRAHILSAMAAHIPWRLAPLDSLAYDLDRPGDLDRFRASAGPHGARTRRFLNRIHASGRVVPGLYA